jgi:hypothetical protein
MTSENKPMDDVKRYISIATLVKFNYVICAMIVLGILYVFLEFFSPRHFGESMYSPEGIFRVIFLSPILVLVVLGFILFWRGWQREKKGIFWTGNILIWLAFLCLIPQVKCIYKAYQEDARHNIYHQKSVEELSQLARENMYGQALRELVARRTPESIDAVKQILIDENEKEELRVCAARWLSKLDDEEINQFLEKIEQTTTSKFIKGYLSQMRIARERR